MDQHRRRTVSSDIGRVAVPDSSMNQRVIQVPDESQGRRSFSSTNFNEDFDRDDYVNQRQQIQEQKNIASKEAIGRFEILAGIGRLTEDITIDGATFSIRSLKAKERKDIQVRHFEAKTIIDKNYILKIYLLAYSLYKIDNQPTEDVFGPGLQNAIDSIEEFDDTVLEELLDRYNKMMDAHKKLIPEDLGETPEEVVANIKKS